MKLFCNCNSKWTYQSDNDKLCWLFEKGYKGIDDEGYSIYIGNELDYCSTCRKIKWYDAYYENMMFDLKRMNEC